VRRADHEHRPRLQLIRSAVVGGVELPNRGIELGRELGHDRVLVLEHTGRDDYVVRAEPKIAGGHDVPGSVPVELVHGDPGSDG
jgi:hypothetical protein